MSTVLEEALADPLYEQPLEIIEPPSRQRRRSHAPTSAPPRDDLPIVSIGRPRAWPIDSVLDPAAIPPQIKASLDVDAFFVVRLACSFRPRRGDVSVAWAQLILELKPDEQGVAPLAYDLYPLSVERERTVSKTLSLSPTLKFSEVEAGVGEATYSVQYPSMEPMLTASGVHESNPSWNFTAVSGYPLVGAKLLHAVVYAPRELRHLTVAVSLTADLDYGRRRFSAWLRGDPTRAQPSIAEVRLWP